MVRIKTSGKFDYSYKYIVNGKFIINGNIQYSIVTIHSHYGNLWLNGNIYFSEW